MGVGGKREGLVFCRLVGCFALVALLFASGFFKVGGFFGFCVLVFVLFFLSFSGT